MQKGKEKKEKNYIKKGEKGLKNASFWAINSKKNAGGVFRPPLYTPCKLICRGKKLNLKKGGRGNDLVRLKEKMTKSTFFLFIQKRGVNTFKSEK